MVREQALISVVTAFLNAERFIEETIESVLAQTYRRWELLLVDDGSTDRSTAVARSYAERHPDRIRYFEHEGHAHRGTSLSRNVGVREARGEYVAFLDADDVYLPQKLERQAAILDAHPQAAMVYGATLYWHSWPGNPAPRRDWIGPLGVQPDRLYEPPVLLTRYLRDGRTIPCLCGLLVRRAALQRLGAFEEHISRLFEDQVLLAKICAHAPVFVESGCWERYRQHPDSTSRAAIRAGEFHPTQPNPAHLVYLTWLQQHLRTLGVRDRDLARALAQALLPYRHPTLSRSLKALRTLLRGTGRRIRRAAALLRRVLSGRGP